MQDAIVLDNSVVISWCFIDEANQYADDVLDALKYVRAIVPCVWPLEVENVLVIAERQGSLRYGDCIRFLELLSELPIDIVQQPSEKAANNNIYTIAREAKLSTYDASYLELAIKRNLSLATLDKGLLKAAREFNVEIFKKPNE